MRSTRTRQSRRTFVAGGLAGAVALFVSQPAPSQDRRPRMEISIRPDSEIVTLINVFAVEPDNQEKLIRLLREGTETSMSKQSGVYLGEFSQEQGRPPSHQLRAMEKSAGHRRFSSKARNRGIFQARQRGGAVRNDRLRGLLCSPGLIRPGAKPARWAARPGVASSSRIRRAPARASGASDRVRRRALWPPLRAHATRPGRFAGWRRVSIAA
jgi:hypothetical protein